LLVFSWLTYLVIKGYRQGRRQQNPR